MKLVEEDKTASEYLQVCQAAAHAELECTDLRRQCHHLKKYAQAQEKDARNTEKSVDMYLMLWCVSITVYTNFVKCSL